MTVIELRPHAWGWKVFEMEGVEPVFSRRDEAISYCKERHRKGEVHVINSNGTIEAVLSLNEPPLS